MNLEIAGLLYDIEAKITGKTGNSISDKVYFNAVSPVELTDDDLFKIQCNLGYHPHGYGSYGLGKVLNADSKHSYTWYSSACCD